MIITVTVDCNIDRVIIHNSESKKSVGCDVKYPILVLKMLEELLNVITTNDSLILEQIDEDTRKVIAEW